MFATKCICSCTMDMSGSVYTHVSSERIFIVLYMQLQNRCVLCLLYNYKMEVSGVQNLKLYNGYFSSYTCTCKIDVSVCCICSCRMEVSSVYEYVTTPWMFVMCVTAK